VVSAQRAAELNRSCAHCHASIAAEWEQSLHRQAFTNDYFTRALQQENTPFCRKCHAPDADPALMPSPVTARDGVSCVGCHLTPSGIMGADGVSAVPPADEAAPGHSRFGDARWRSPAVCAGCHQFEFPKPRQGTSDELAALSTPMQDTHAEHAASKYADMTCQSCHMPKVSESNGRVHTDHRFDVQKNSTLLAQAIRVELVERLPSRVVVALVPGRIGHAFPTGDLFRRAELRLTVNEPGGRVMSRTTYALQRTYEYEPATGGRRVVSDTRLAPAQRDDEGRRVVELPLATEGRAINWRVVWQRMPPGAGHALGMDWTAHERVVAQGVWAP
jgi:hypothetical protein